MRDWLTERKRMGKKTIQPIIDNSFLPEQLFVRWCSSCEHKTPQISEAHTPMQYECLVCGTKWLTREVYLPKTGTHPSGWYLHEEEVI